jgi:hypothetical protein
VEGKSQPHDEHSRGSEEDALEFSEIVARDVEAQPDAFDLQAAGFVSKRFVHVQSDGCLHGGNLFGVLGTARNQPISGTP